MASNGGTSSRTRQLPEKLRITEIYPDGSQRTRELIVTPLRYGENWDQRGAVLEPTSAHHTELRGRKAVSFNNEGDMDRAFRLVERLDRHLPLLRGGGIDGEDIVAIVKHTEASGAAIRHDQENAFRDARLGDVEANFGGIAASNKPWSVATTNALLDTGHFLECIVAPGFEVGVPEMIPKGKTVRLVDFTPEWTTERGTLYSEFELRSLSRGRILIQDPDTQAWAGEQPWRLATVRRPTEAELANAIIAWDVAWSMTSNAVALVNQGQLIGAAGGQQKRADSARFAGLKAHKMGFKTDGASAATDGFFPFPDGVEELYNLGARTIMCPGGEKNKGKNEPEVLAKANELGMSLLFTDKRTFRH